MRKIKNHIYKCQPNTKCRNNSPDTHVHNTATHKQFEMLEWGHWTQAPTWPNQDQICKGQNRAYQQQNSARTQNDSPGTHAHRAATQIPVKILEWSHWTHYMSMAMWKSQDQTCKHQDQRYQRQSSMRSRNDLPRTCQHHATTQIPLQMTPWGP